MPVTSLKYVEIAEKLRARIKSGEYEPGDRLPSEPHIQEEFGGVSKATVRAAMAQLRSEGLVETRHGLGTFVRESKELVRWAGGRYRVDGGAPNLAEEEAGGYKQEVTAERSTLQASPEIAARLRIEAGDMVSQVIYRWYVDGEPVQVSTQWEPLALTKGTPIEIPSGGERYSPDVMTRFEKIGYPVDEVDEDIRSRMPTPDEAAMLRIPDGVPVFIIQRTHLSSVPVETADIISRADRFVIQVRQEVKRP